MGIPSYYRFLCQKNKSIIQPNYDATNNVVLCLDFNCIVYYCLSKVGEYVDDLSYESLLIKEVCKYVEHIYKSANKPNELFIAVDGVVPMAKMKQQRMRRFKGLFMAPYEIENNVKTLGQKSWDKNAITPGTLFMKKLHSALLELCSAHKNWSISGYDMFGEGEHKVMKYIRDNTTTNSTFLVYGLDADLILLSMLQSKSSIFLMREEMEFNSVVKDIYEKEQFLYLNINKLKSTLFNNPTEEHIQDYIMMMSLLGNDFLPHSLSLTIKDNGYNILFNNLRMFHKQNKWLVKDKQIQWEVLKEFINTFVTQEVSLIETNFKKKKMSFNYKPHNDYEQKMANVYTLPAKWYVESELYDTKMKDGWEEKYYAKYLNDNKEVAIEGYLKGLQWILDYYNGNPIENDWCYPYMYTPLWIDIYKYLCNDYIGKGRFVYDIQSPITPEQQLVLVLPIESYSLIQNIQYRKFPAQYPQYYPTKFSVHSLGKKYIYECESNIPVLTSKFLRNILV